ncbi:hypothetical protein [uncultured Lamprocystis sp.]|jgi:hypothetical protein|uniref:hypothetical protein n=1 Tax=uncultured Lamprocystis sp. TaxID=543132 RepID=UPI0025E9ED76|nr:hypothetical protein [uncultured Lamprocystis sp.]
MTWNDFLTALARGLDRLDAPPDLFAHWQRTVGTQAAPEPFLDHAETLQLRLPMQGPGGCRRIVDACLIEPGSGWRAIPRVGARRV